MREIEEHFEPVVLDDLALLPVLVHEPEEVGLVDDGGLGVVLVVLCELGQLLLALLERAVALQDFLLPVVLLVLDHFLEPALLVCIGGGLLWTACSMVLMR